MIDERDVYEMASGGAYSRGVQIQRSYWKIEEFSVETEGNSDVVRAVVAGSGDNHYEVEITYDAIVDEAKDIFCECPAFYSYQGICKHCVAVLLEYIDYKGRNRTQSDNLRQGEPGIQEQQRILPGGRRGGQKNVAKSAVRTSSGMQKAAPPKPVQRVVPQTTRDVKELLSRQVRTRTAPVVQRGVYGQVALVPYVVYTATMLSRELKVEFKVGDGHMYVVKDVFELARRIRGQEDYEYGKKLKFIHGMPAFAEKYHGLVRFVLDWTRRNAARYQQSSYSYGYGYVMEQQKLRAIPLNGYDLEELLEVLKDAAFYLTMDGKERTGKLVEEAYLRRLVISGKEGWVEISSPSCVRFQGKKYLMYLDGDTIYRMPDEREFIVKDFTECLEQNKNKLSIRDEDMPAFCTRILPVLEKHFRCKKENFDEETFLIATVQFSFYLDAPQKDYVTCQCMACYGEKKYNLYDRGTDKNVRDAVSEAEVEQSVSSWFNAYNPEEKKMVIAEDEELLYMFLTEGIQSLQKLGEVYISDALKRLKVSGAPKMEVGVSLSGGLLELSMSVEDISREELLEILSRYQKKKKFYRLKSGEFVDIDDERIAMLAELKAGMGIRDKEFLEDVVTLPKYRALYLDAQLKENQSLPAVKNREFRALVRDMKTIEDNDFELPKEMANVLREYQKRGFLWIKTLKQNGFCGILADDMGLGKTLQVIAFLLSEHRPAYLTRRENLSLIVTPASLVLNWQSEIQRFAPGLPVRVITGSAEERKQLLAQIQPGDILVTSYDLLKRDITGYTSISFENQVIDEAQFIKNHDTQAAKAVRRVSAGFKLALTGTPVENRLSELWSIFEYLMPGFLYPYQRFKKEIETPIVHDENAAAGERLRKMVRPFILRRLKKDVLKDLPDKIEKNMCAKLEDEQQRLYDAHVKRLKMLLDKQTDEEFKSSKIMVLSEITKLRQICCCPALIYEDYPYFSAKENLCVELIQNAREGGHKVLLFSQFTSMLERLEKRFSQEKISYYVLTGATPKEKRMQMVEAFQNDDTAVFCISLKAGGTGLNLTAADIVIHYDPWWNLAVQNQATDRAHRIGQENVVSVYKLIAKGTIEENIVKLQEKKKELAEQILGGEGMGNGRFDKEELLELLGN